MGGNQTVQPVIGEEGVGPAMEIPPLGHAPTSLASFDSLDESRQHANGPDARFGASPDGMRRFGLLSQRHSAAVAPEGRRRGR